MIFENLTKCGALSDLVPFVQFKNRGNTHGGVLILVKLQAAACNFTKINTPPWVFFTVFKLYKWYKIAQRTTNQYNSSFSIEFRKQTRTSFLLFI